LIKPGFLFGYQHLSFDRGKWALFGSGMMWYCISPHD
jgi:hypothetical protein